MVDLYEIEVEPEVRSWLEGLTARDSGRVDFLVGLLAERAETLGEPYSRHLKGKVCELRFHLLGPADSSDALAGGGPAGGFVDRVPQDPQRRDC